MSAPAFDPLGPPLPSGQEPRTPIQRVSRAVRPRPAHARRLVVFTARVLSAPANARARRNALQAAQEMAEHRRTLRAAHPYPDHTNAPERARDKGSPT